MAKRWAKEWYNMVSIIPSERTSGDVLGKLIGENLSRNLPGAIEKGYDRQMMRNSIDEISEMSKDSSKSPLDILLGSLKASAGIPGSERYMAQILPEIMKLAKNNNSFGVAQPGEGYPSAAAIPARQELPGLGSPMTPAAKQENPFFPTNKGVQDGPGNAPQAATLGQKYKLMTPSERIAEGRRIAQENTRAGNSMSIPEGIEQVDKYIQYSDEYNKQVDVDTAQRVASQEKYGEKAVDQLKRVFTSGKTTDPILTPEIEAIFRKKGEEKSKTGDSEANIERYLSKEADRFKNAIVNVRKDLDAPRSTNALQRLINGNYKSAEAAAKDLRNNLQPVLELGLYDVARNLLENKGYGPEERDYIINPMNVKANAIISSLPEGTRVKGGDLGNSIIRSNIAPDQMKETLIGLKQADPNFSLLLARKALEDKGVQWREFKDVFNEMVSSGQLELEDDQKNQMGYLDTPPLSSLDKILEGLNFIGR